MQHVITAATNNPVPANFLLLTAVIRAVYRKGQENLNFHVIFIPVPFCELRKQARPIVIFFLGSNLSTEVTVSGATNYEYFMPIP